MRLTDLLCMPRRILNSPYCAMNLPKKSDKYWTRQRVFRFSAYFYGRRRHCYKVAVNRIHNSWQKNYEDSVLQLKWDEWFRKLRVDAGLQEHGFKYPQFAQMLIKSNVGLSLESLANLAAFEPRSFQSLAMLMKQLAIEEGFGSFPREPKPKGVITRNQVHRGPSYREPVPVQEFKWPYYKL